MAKNYVHYIDFQGMATADLSKRWASAGSFSINTNSAKCWFGATRNAFMSNPCTITLPANTTKVCMGGWFFFDCTAFGSSTGSNVFMAAVDTITVQVNVGMDILGRICFYNGNGTLLARTSGQVVWPSQICHIEVKFTISTSTSSGDCKCWVNGVEVLSIGAGVSTRNSANTYANSVQFGHAATNGFYCQSLFVVDWSSGDAPPVGMKRNYNLTPNGDGATNNFVGSDGNSTSNYLLVDDMPLDTADYTGSSTTNEVDLYAFTDLSVTPASIEFVQLSTAVVKSDAGARTCRNLIRSGGTNYDSGVDITPSVSYLLYPSIWYTDPATSVAWTKSGVDALQGGLKITA